MCVCTSRFSFPRATLEDSSHSRGGVVRASQISMGYGGYAPGDSSRASELNDLERALRALPVDQSMAALDLMETLTRNTAQNPKEEKFRKIRWTNEKLAAMTAVPGARDALLEMGWVPEGEDFLVLPKNMQLDFGKHVGKILEAKSYYAKRKEAEKKAAKIAGDPNKAATMKELEIDRRERAAAAATATNGGGRVATPSPPPAPTTTKEQPAAVAPAAVAAVAPSAEKQAAPGGDEKTAAAATVPAEKKGTAGGPSPDAGPMSLQELRAMQKSKYKEFEADPNARKSNAYQQGPSVWSHNNKPEEKGWWDSWFGGGSSSSNNRKPPSDRQGPRIKGVADLPKPPPRMGGG